MALDDRVPRNASLGLLLRLAGQHWTHAVESALAEAGFDGLRPPHSNVFTFTPPEGIQVSELSKLAHVRKQSMAQAVDELEKLGYVERRPDPRDGRARLVFLTARGRQVKPVAMAAGDRVDRRWRELTSSAEIESLRRALRSLLDRLHGPAA